MGKETLLPPGSERVWVVTSLTPVRAHVSVVVSRTVGSSLTVVEKSGSNEEATGSHGFVSTVSESSSGGRNHSDLCREAGGPRATLDLLLHLAARGRAPGQLSLWLCCDPSVTGVHL